MSEGQQESAPAQEPKTFPIWVEMSGIRIANYHNTIEPTGLFSKIKPGAMVMVRPCDKELQGKTFLGMYLCSAPTGFQCKQVGNEIVLTMVNHTNPAIYVPELDRIVWGYESWWGEIKNESQLRQITDEDIQNVWYVRALQQLNKTDAETQEQADESAAV